MRLVPLCVLLCLCFTTAARAAGPPLPADVKPLDWEGDIASRLVDAADAFLLRELDRAAAKREAAWTPPPKRYERGYGAMFSQHIGQADEGCDFDFLQGTARTAEPEIH